MPSKRVKMEPINVKKFSKIPDQAIVFNMCNEPATKYSLLSIADKSSDPEGKKRKLYHLNNFRLYIPSFKIKSFIFGNSG